MPGRIIEYLEDDGKPIMMGITMSKTMRNNLVRAAKEEQRPIANYIKVAITKYMREHNGLEPEHDYGPTEEQKGIMVGKDNYRTLSDQSKKMGPDTQ